jgi:hypothetical protein
MIHLIGFYTQGPPFDNARDLSESKTRFQALFENQVDTIKLYNTTLMMVMNKKFKTYIDSVPEYKFLNGWTHHFWKWKPFVLYEHLKTMNDQDILVYHDCDYQPEYEIDASRFRENVMSVLENHELVCSIDSLYTKNKEVTKEEVFRQFGDYRDTKLLRTDRIFLKKTPKTLQFIYNWLTLCDTSLLLPSYMEKHAYSQSLFNVLYYKYIEMGELPYPTVYFKDNLFSKDTILFLDKMDLEENPIPVQGNVVKGIKGSEPFVDTTPDVTTPVRRMLQPHQSNRAISMTLIPIAKPPQNVVRRKPPSFFTLSKSR